MSIFKPNNLEWRYFLLFASLLFLGFGYSFFNFGAMAQSADAIVTAIVMSVILYTVWQSPHMRFVCLGLYILTIISITAAEFSPAKDSVILANALVIIFLCFTAMRVLRTLLKVDTVTLGTVYGVLSVYLFLGLIWAHGYLILNLLDPHALSQPLGADQLTDALYLSFDTLGTLGAGDITPVSHQAKAMITLEVVSGNLFLVAWVARFVGLEISHRMHKRMTQKD